MERRLVAGAFTLVEAIVSIVIVGVMLVAALNTVAASQTTQRKMSDRNRAMLLAQDLMSEILRQPYEDPDYAPGSFGLGADEVGDGSRALWEDVDDYDGWKASPPQQKDGTLLAGFDGWTRGVVVNWVQGNDITAVSGVDTGVKRIVVTVTRDNLPLATLEALRTNAWDYGPEEQE